MNVPPPKDVWRNGFTRFQRIWLIACTTGTALVAAEQLVVGGKPW